MSYDYSAKQSRILELIQNQTKGDGLLAACTAAGHRKHFFAEVGTELRRRGQTLFNAVDAFKLAGDRAKPGKPQWQAFCEGRPLSLVGILKIDDVLRAIAEHKKAEVRELTSVRGVPFELPGSSVIPSVYYALPEDFRDYRADRLGGGRESLSATIFGPGRKHTLKILEAGTEEGHARVTGATVDRLADVVGEGVFDLFTHDAARGPRNGENTFALLPSNGNFLSYTRQERDAAQAAN